MLASKKTEARLLGANGFRYRRQFGVIVICKNERDQARTYNVLRRRGFECLSNEIRDDPPRRLPADRGQFLGRQKDVVIEIQRRSHASNISHHASGVKAGQPRPTRRSPSETRARFNPMVGRTKANV